MTRRMRAAALAALSLAQLAAAGWSIARYEWTLASGAVYRIRTIAVDPADAFRGRYVAVQPAVTISEPLAGETRQLIERIQSGETGYVVLATGADGFAKVSRVLVEPPAEGDYLKVAHVWQQWNPAPQPGGESARAGYSVRFSFDRYYMNEAAAPEAETRYAAATRRGARTDTWLTVRIKDGVGVIEGLFVDGTAIEELITAAPRP
jgi:uncharacterized membrane-anchored protein